MSVLGQILPNLLQITAINGTYTVRVIKLVSIHQIKITPILGLSVPEKGIFKLKIVLAKQAKMMFVCGVESGHFGGQQSKIDLHAGPV